MTEEKSEYTFVSTFTENFYELLVLVLEIPRLAEIDADLKYSSRPTTGSRAMIRSHAIFLEESPSSKMITTTVPIISNTRKTEKITPSTVIVKAY